MIPAHIELCTIDRSSRIAGDEIVGLSECLTGLQNACSTFEYKFTELNWDENSKELYLDPVPCEPFAALRSLVFTSLGLLEPTRQLLPMRLLLADKEDGDAYLLKEDLTLMNGGLLPLRCRATEIEVYFFQSGNWLLRESIPFQESEDN